jgi:hypothetical protein
MVNDYRIENKGDYKYLMSENLNYVFNRQSGFSAVWGATKEEDPDFSPFGPFIADIEVTTNCKGPGGKLCPFCYKANTPNGDYMSFDLFQKVFDKLPHQEMIEVELENGDIIKFNPDDVIKTTNGSKIAKNITENDDLCLSL